MIRTRLPGQSGWPFLLKIFLLWDIIVMENLSAKFFIVLRFCEGTEPIEMQGLSEINLVINDVINKPIFCGIFKDLSSLD